MTKNELEIGRKKAKEVLRQVAGWKASFIEDEQIDHFVQAVVEAIDDYRKAKKG